MRRGLKHLAGVGIVALSVANFGFSPIAASAQGSVQIQGTIQTVDCGTNALVLNALDGPHVFPMASDGTVTINSVQASFCALAQYVGSRATVSIEAVDSRIVAGHVDVSTSATPVVPANPATPAVPPPAYNPNNESYPYPSYGYYPYYPHYGYYPYYPYYGYSPYYPYYPYGLFFGVGIGVGIRIAGYPYYPFYPRYGFYPHGGYYPHGVFFTPSYYYRWR